MKKKNLTGRLLIALAWLFVLVMLVVPLFGVLYYALQDGAAAYWQALTDVLTRKALRLTLLAAVIAVVVTTGFGLASAWLLTRFHFRGRGVLATLIDLPFAISPVIAGLVFVLTYGRRGWLYPLLHRLDLQVVFAVPGVVLATIFVTFPYVTREIVPLLNAAGTQEEEAAALMGAGGWTIFRRITLPRIKWALLYGIILVSARALGEYGAVAIVSGHLSGYTNTLPLQIEQLYQGFQITAAFSVSSLLVLLAMVILVAKNIVEYKGQKERYGHGH